MKNVLTRRATLALLGATGVLALAACATYKQPELPAKELATISVDPNSSALRLFAVDGNQLSSVGGLIALGGREEQKILPGKRSVTVQLLGNGGLASGYSTLMFEAKAGNGYLVRERSEGLKFTIWITDESGVVVPLIKADK